MRLPFRRRLLFRARRSRTSLRTTFAVSFAAVAAVVTLLVGLIGYDAAAHLVRRDQQSVFTEVVGDLRSQVRSRDLDAEDYAAGDLDHDGLRDGLTRPTRADVQVLAGDGRIVDQGSRTLPVGPVEQAVAADAQAGKVARRDIEIGGEDYRLATVALGGGRGAVQVAQQFSDTEDLLKELQDRTVLLACLVVLAAGLVGWWLARRITRRLVRLAYAAEGVAATGRVDIQVPVAGRDEVGRLGRSFDHMLGRLAQSEDDQRRLVQDAGHELRTPLTSLRTNISLLRRIDELPPDQRAELVDDLAEESRELTDLVNELVDLAAGGTDDGRTEELTLAEVALEAAAAARRRTGRPVTVRTTDADVFHGRPAALQRAVTNLIENAAKFDRDGTEPIEISVTGRRVAVLDRGPGVAEADADRIFDRFYRAAGARSLPGSGLGLSIVRDVAATHAGTVFVQGRPGGGAVIGFTVGEGERPGGT
ncbi:HAMP domain-containing sensor histidine kinase [Streptomyces luteocolor]|uniref:HAMP domain-containing sensor histidine kinase n=1 Tax=Streptomyces luteocolor TaxID=285500 RepID=UPI00085396EC|nr:HAMP domain-containing sensor histidine kinase [Streptomyces luteocolor]